MALAARIFHMSVASTLSCWSNSIAPLRRKSLFSFSDRWACMKI